MEEEKKKGVVQSRQKQQKNKQTLNRKYSDHNRLIKQYKTSKSKLYYFMLFHILFYQHNPTNAVCC